MWWDYHLSVDPICQSFDAKTSFKILMLLGYEVNLWWDLNERCSIMNYFDRVFFSWRAQLFMCVNFGINFNFVMYFTIYEIQIVIVFVIYVISRNLSSIMFTSSNFKTFVFDDEYCDDVIFVIQRIFAIILGKKINWSIGSSWLIFNNLQIHHFLRLLKNNLFVNFRAVFCRRYFFALIF